ncbi:MAG: DJ-1 family glyoxalase III [Treponema sp.]|nr:DJ-1 family glyoxalase III [Treponema sp.]
MKKAVVFLADGFEEIEAVTIIDYLRRADTGVQTVAVPSPSVQKENMVRGSHGIFVKADLSFVEFEKEYSSQLPDLVYVPGGMPGSVNLGLCHGVCDFLVRCYENGKITSALCAAPAVVLAKTGILKGKKWTCYPGMEEGLVEYCGTPERMMELMEGSRLERSVPFVVDGNLVTGRGPGTAEQFAMQLVLMLHGQKVADLIHAGSIQR